MLTTSARLLALLSLLQTRRDWSGTELADRLAVSVRTVRRDVDRLRDLGYPVRATQGTAGYRLVAGTALPPLLLDDEEAVAVAVGLRTAAGGTVAGIAETSVRALAKLEQVLPSRLRHRVNTLQSTMVPLADPGLTVDAATLTVLASACRDHESVRFDYHDHRATASTRIVEPFRLACTGRRWYLLAWDTDREDWRTFRVDRIAAQPTPGRRFTPRDPPEEDIAAYLSRTISSSPYRYHAKVTLHAPAETIIERITPATGRVEVIDNHSCLLHAGANSLDGLAVGLAQIGVDFEVHHPPELVRHLHTVGDRLKRAAIRSGNVASAGDGGR